MSVKIKKHTPWKIKSTFFQFIHGAIATIHETLKLPMQPRKTFLEQTAPTRIHLFYSKNGENLMRMYLLINNLFLPLSKHHMA